MWSMSVHAPNSKQLPHPSASTAVSSTISLNVNMLRKLIMGRAVVKAWSKISLLISTKYKVNSHRTSLACERYSNMHNIPIDRCLTHWGILPAWSSNMYTSWTVSNRVLYASSPASTWYQTTRPQTWLHWCCQDVVTTTPIPRHECRISSTIFDTGLRFSMLISEKPLVPLLLHFGLHAYDVTLPQGPVH